MGKLLRWAEEIEVKKTSSGLAKNARYTRYKDTNHREHGVKCEIGGSPALDTRLGTDEGVTQNLIQPQGTKKGGLSDSASSAPSVSSKNSNILEKIKLLLPSLSEEEINYYYELFEERAAIIEYDSECTKEEVEKLAFEGVKQLCEERNQIIESVIKHMKTLVDAAIPFASINEGYIKGISSVEQLKNLHIPNIKISFLADNSVEIKNLANKSSDNIDKCISKHLKFKKFILDKKEKKEFIDEHDLELYHDEVINRITFKAQVYKGGGRLGIVNIFFVAVAFNKRSLTHEVSSSGIVLISMSTDCYDEEIERSDYVQITGRIKSTDCYEIGKIIYIKADKIKLLKKGLK